MFEHSVKVPRHFKVAANIVKQVSTEGGSVKTLLYDDKLRHFKTNVLYALVTETIKHAVFIDKMFAHCQLLQTENRLDPWLAKILTTELLFGKKTLPRQSKPEQTILSYKEQFEKYASEHQDDLKNEAVPRPRYIRINTNSLTTSDAIRAFQDEGYHFIRCTSGSYNDYLQQIQKLTEFDFTQDYHIKTIFVFAPGTKWHDHALYLENKVILQDKATAMAVHLLAAPSGSVCLDMCAAPGMKTTQLAAYLRNEGKIYAVERDDRRFKTLCDFVEKTGSTCVTTLHKDSLEIKRGDHDEVEYILLDPSCSGSGMDYCVHSYIEEARLAKLTSLQEKFLKHAMNAFPKAKRIIYSTCSVYPEENERVVTNVVKTSRAKWRVRDVKELLKEQWNNFGSGMYGSMGTRCMYAKPQSDFTTGFFLAVIDRDDRAKDYRNQEIVVGDSKDEGKMKMRREGEGDKNGVDVNKKRKTKNDTEVAEEAPKKKKRDDKTKMSLEEVDTEVVEEAPKKKKRDDKIKLSLEKVDTEVVEEALKKKKRDDKTKMSLEEVDTEVAEEAPKKKKRDDKTKLSPEEVDTEVAEEAPKKKKRDDKTKLSLEEVDTEVVEEAPKKKKRDDKTKLSPEEVDTEVAEEAPKKKKRDDKTKLSLEEVDTEVAEEAPKKMKRDDKTKLSLEEVEQKEIVKIKTKRKLNDVCDSLGDLSIEETASDEAPKKKKKKKDKVRDQDVEIIENSNVILESSNANETEKKSSKKEKKYK